MEQKDVQEVGGVIPLGARGGRSKLRPYGITNIWLIFIQYGLIVVFGSLFEREPLVGVVAEDDHGGAFTLGKLKEFAGAGDSVFGVEVHRAAYTITGEIGLHGNGVDSE